MHHASRARLIIVGRLCALPLAGCGDGVVTGEEVTDDAVADGKDGDEESTSTDEMPDNEFCAAVDSWDSSWTGFEEEVLQLVNARRAAGADCGSGGTFESADPLAMNAQLRCAARSHSQAMGRDDFFAHTDPDGNGPGERIASAGYSPRTWGENIAFGQATPEQVMDAWMNSDGHCANIMNGSFTEIGVGYYEGNLWTQAFGAPR